MIRNASVTWPADAGAAEHQSSILHVTLGRVLEPHQLDHRERAAIQAQCDEWTTRLKGLPFTPASLWCASAERVSPSPSEVCDSI